MSASETVLVTGSRGFTGHHVCTTLHEAGWAVHGVVHGPAEASNESACDLTDPAQVQRLVDTVRPERVVHLAGLAFVNDADPEAFYRVNLFGTLHLLEALARHSRRVRKVVLASSAQVYGHPMVEQVDESLCPAPVNHYGCSKLAMEHMAATWFGRLPIIITRPFNYTGPGQEERFLVPKIAAHYARREQVIELGNLEVERDIGDVRDVAEAYRRLLLVDAEALCVNVASGQPRSLRSILHTCELLTGHRLEVRINPDLVRTNDPPRLTGDIRGLERLIGARELVPFERTLEDLCRALAPQD